MSLACISQLPKAWFWSEKCDFIIMVMVVLNSGDDYDGNGDSGGVHDRW